MIILAVALLAGMACVAILARGMASSQARPSAAPAPPPRPVLQVLVAKRDLAVGDRIDTPDVGWQSWPADATNPAYVTDGSAPAAAPVASSQNLTGAATQIATAATKSMAGDPSQGRMSGVIGALVRTPILAGEPIMTSKLVHAGAAGVMAVTLDPGKRAMALPLTAESAVGGFILPGDHVDVVMSRPIDGPPGAMGSSTKQVSATVVLNNVRVLAIDQNNAGPQKITAQVGATATVEVSPEQAEQLVVAKAVGQLTLVLRSYADVAGPATSGSNVGADGNIVHVYSPGETSSVMVTQ
jgi:pilus assembly protein CpaB